jgi:hypothetical protein
MTEHRDGRLARGETMLREKIGDGTIRRAFLSQLRDDPPLPGANPGTSADGAA